MLVLKKIKLCFLFMTKTPTKILSIKCPYLVAFANLLKKNLLHLFKKKSLSLKLEIKIYLKKNALN